MTNPKKPYFTEPVQHPCPHSETMIHPLSHQRVCTKCGEPVLASAPPKRTLFQEQG